MAEPVVGIIMGADKDLPVMSEAAKVFDEFNVPYEVRIISAHRTPEVIASYAGKASKRGLKVIIAGAGGSAHLPGMTASHTLLPVLAVPVKAPNHDHEALWSNIKMPTNIPLATMPENNARNAALMAIEILALGDAGLAEKYAAFRKNLHDDVVAGDKKLQQLGWKEFLSETVK
ncbi:MAG TPA: 5-(carboxyamino)imidazole ribonucleotide mutase [Candidatus Saccharimonadales bacterium]|jgi:phosphoribosylaminoimidazole carboxylase PurE protein|nr:5-(carboxyamino)imidazole ribonucleotide mutase [Candidatus Saccharimonadales bacterium]